MCLSYASNPLLESRGEEKQREERDRRREIKRGWSCVEKISEERKKVKVKRGQGEERQEMKQG